MFSLTIGGTEPVDGQGNNQILEILKWVGIVFAAGFIGYFGRYLAMLIIGRMHQKNIPQSAKESTTEPPSNQYKKPQYDAKTEKKRLKLEAKQAKKEQKK